LISVVWGWEEPKDLADGFDEDGVSKGENVHGDDEHIHEVNNEVGHLIFVNSNTQHVSKLQVMERIVMEEPWNRKLRLEV